MKKKSFTMMALLLFVTMACSFPGLGSQPPETAPPPSLNEDSSTAPTDTPAPITHLIIPPTDVKIGKPVYDVRSDVTANENRAPYGDAYNINRFERPFTQDMTYISDMDILSYTLGLDDTWYFVSIELIGRDPNNSMGINFGVEVDLDWDGYGDFIVWGSPQYTTDWSTDTVQVFRDSNHDTAGLSSARSDAVFDGDGYENLVFDRGVGDDPDLAWVRMNAGDRADIQFAFKRSLINSPFMFGVVADSGLRDVSRYDYNDSFIESDAGSPEISEQYYPLKELFGIDNSCQTAIGFKPTGYEPKLCPVDPTPTPGPGSPGDSCVEPPGGCDFKGGYYWSDLTCSCELFF